MKHGRFENSKGYKPRFTKNEEKVIQENLPQQSETPSGADPEVLDTPNKTHSDTKGLKFGSLLRISGNRNSGKKTDPAKSEKEVSPARNALDYLRDFVSLLSAVLLVLLLLLRIVVVSGSSMRNTLIDGDYIILLSNVFYSDYKQGDVVVASKEDFRNGEPIIKRVIATEGQEVFINFEEGVVYVDGKALDEPYTLTPTNRDEGIKFPIVVDKGCVFVLGDNRNASKDSRNAEIGQIDCREILGKAVFILLPGVDEVSKKRDFSRIGVIS